MLVLETPRDLSYSESIRTLYDAEPFFTLAAIAWTLRIRSGVFPPVVLYILTIVKKKNHIYMLALLSQVSLHHQHFILLFIFNIFIWECLCTKQRRILPVLHLPVLWDDVIPNTNL